MNYDTLWTAVRQLLIIIGAFAVGRGWLTDAIWTQVIGLVGVVLPLVWDWYVKWNTTPVLDAVIERRSIPSVSSLTGQVITEAKK